MINSLSSFAEAQFVSPKPDDDLDLHQISIDGIESWEGRQREVCLWHKADIPKRSADVRFWG
jgi:hypothetical protein